MAPGRGRSGVYQGVLRIFELTTRHMLWSGPMIYMALIVAAPVAVAVIAMVVRAKGFLWIDVNGARLGDEQIVGIMMRLLFMRFIVPVLGVFAGMSLIADEVENKTITYLFTRPIPRHAILLGKYLAYVFWATCALASSITISYLLVMPMAGAGSLIRLPLSIIAIACAGLAVYAAVFALVGTLVKRPLVVGLVFVFGWEQVVLLMPGYLKQLTIAHHLEAVLQTAVPTAGSVSLLQMLLREPVPPVVDVIWLCGTLMTALALAMAVIDRREYLLEQ